MTGAVCNTCGSATPECACRDAAVECIVRLFAAAKRGDLPAFARALAHEKHLRDRFTVREWIDIHADAHRMASP